MTSLAGNAVELQRVAALPEGWVIARDHRTDNLLVHDGERGFPVSSVCLNDWPMDRIVADVQAAVSDIRATGSSKVVPVFSVPELIAQGG